MQPLFTTVKLYRETYRIKLTFKRYAEGDRVAISAWEVDSVGRVQEPFGTLTTNLPHAPLEPREILVKTWSENESWVPGLLVKMPEVFRDTGKRVRTGFVTAQVWELLAPLGEEA